MEHKRQIAKENNEGLLPLSYIETLQINLHGMSEREVMGALKMELHFITEFQSYKQDYLLKLEEVMQVYSETRQKDILNFIF